MVCPKTWVMLLSCVCFEVGMANGWHVEERVDFVCPLALCCIWGVFLLWLHVVCARGQHLCLVWGGWIGLGCVLCDESVREGVG